MRHPEYQRVAGEIAELEARRPVPGTPEAEKLELLRRRLQVHDALADRRTPSPDCDGMLHLLERAFRR